MAITTYCVKTLNKVIDHIDIQNSNPFQEKTIVYQSYGLKDLLVFGLTEREGVTANLKFKTLQQWINELSLKIGYQVNQEPLIWKVYGTFIEKDFPSAPELEAYLKDDLRAIQLSEKIAALFDDYFNYKTIPTSGWQKELWEQIPEAYFPGAQTQFVIHNMDKIHLNQKIHLVGLDFITPLQWEFLEAIGKNNDIIIYHVDSSVLHSTKKDFYSKFKNELTEKFKGLGAFEVLEDEEPKKESILKVLQQGSNATHDFSLDDSVRVVNAYSKKREVQELYNHLLYQCQFHGIKPADIQILCPNITEYQPYIEAIFASDDFPIQLPYYIADTPATAFTQRVDLVLDTFTLEETLNLKQVASFIERKFIQKEYGINDYHNAVELLKRTSFITGLGDDENGSGLDLIGWRQSKKRLIYGITMMSTAPYDGVMPFEELDEPLVAEALAVIRLVDDLFEYGKAAGKKSFKEWFQLFAQRYASLFISQEDAEEFNPEDHNIWYLFEGLQNNDHPVSAAIFQHIVRSQLTSYGKNHKRNTNGIVISDLSSNKGIQRKVTCIIGLNESRYPTKEVSYAFDLLKDNPIRITTKEKQFLEYQSAVLCAEDNLYLSYVGVDTKKNTDLLPSIFLNQTLYEISKITGITEKEIIEKHPANALSDYYTNEENEAFTFLKDTKQKNNIYTKEHVESFSAPALSLEELIKYFKNPSQWYFNNILNTYLKEKEDQVPDHEAFQMDNLTNWFIRNEYLSPTSTRGIQESQQNLKLPLGGYGEAIFEKETNTLSQLKETLQDQYQVEKIKVDPQILQLENGQKCMGLPLELLKHPDEELPYLLYFEPSKNIDGKIGKNAIELTFKGAYLAAIGIRCQVKYFYPTEDGEADFKRFIFDDAESAKSWLSNKVDLFLKPPPHRPVFFYPKRFFQERNEDFNLQRYENHFFPGEHDKEYPNIYEVKAYKKAKEHYHDYATDAEDDWHTYYKFWDNIL